MTENMLIVSWQLTRRCNLECQYCFTDSCPSLNADKELSTEECFSVIEKLKASFPDCMLILTGGEPLLRKDIFEICNRTSESFFIVIGSNGTFLTKGIILKLKECNIRGISINIDSLNHNNEFERRILSKKLNSIKFLQEQKFPFIINTTIHKGNISELDQIAEFAYSNVAFLLNLFFLVPTGRGHSLYNLTTSDYDYVVSKVLDIKEKYNGRLTINTKCAPYLIQHTLEDPKNLKIYEGSGGCPAATNYLCITPEGEVLPCPFFPLSVSGGNIKEKSFNQIINSEIFAELRERKLKGRCGKCEFSYLCSGCRARAFIISGDYLEEDPLCPYIPKGDSKLKEEAIIEKGGTVYGYKKSDKINIKWTKDAEDRIKKIPLFIRSMVKKKIETRADKIGIEIINSETLDKIREEVSELPMFKRFHKD